MTTGRDGQGTVTRRITDTMGGGFDLAALEAFCQSVRDHGADGADLVRARTTVRGVIRQLSVVVPLEIQGGYLDVPGARPPVAPAPRDESDQWPQSGPGASGS